MFGTSESRQSNVPLVIPFCAGRYRDARRFFKQVPTKKKRFGKDPFTGEERWFDAKPATVLLKVRASKKLKDAAA